MNCGRRYVYGRRKPKGPSNGFKKKSSVDVMEVEEQIQDEREINETLVDDNMDVEIHDECEISGSVESHKVDFNDNGNTEIQDEREIRGSSVKSYDMCEIQRDNEINKFECSYWDVNRSKNDLNLHCFLFKKKTCWHYNTFKLSF